MSIGDRSTKFDLVSTWSDDCGIFEYASALIGTPALGPRLGQVFARKLPAESARPDDEASAVHRCWTPDAGPQDELIGQLLASQTEHLWVQYHPSFFAPSTLAKIAEILPGTSYQRRVLSVHNPEQLAGSAFLNGFTDIVVHNEATAGQLGEIGNAKVHVIPHFIYSRESFSLGQRTPKFSVATVGFAAKNKHVPTLIEGFSIAFALNPEIRLHILTSPLPTHSAHFELSRIASAIKRSGASQAIVADFRPKAMPDLLSALSHAHLLCLPYADTGESASGAARLGISARVPILRSNSSIFSDLPGGDLVLDDGSPQTIAEALLMLSQMPNVLHEKRTELDTIYGQQNAAEIAKRFGTLLP